MLGLALRIPPAAVPIARGRRGRPELAGTDIGLDFNVSHTGSVALIGVLRTSGRNARIGVDVERVDREVGSDRLARKFLTPAERRRSPISRRTIGAAGSSVLDLQGSDEQGHR